MPAPNGVWFVRAFALNECGASATSNEVASTVGPATAIAPGPPVDVTARVGGQAVTLSWNHPLFGGTVSRYSIDVFDAGGTLLASVPIDGRTTPVTAPGVPRGRYLVRITGTNAAGRGRPSQPLDVVVE